jgi:chloramphenicol 3-O phosphotransferase
MHGGLVETNAVNEGLPGMPGKIIIINGTSSSGKTSILKAVQERMEEPYLDAGIDRFIWMMPKRYLDRPLWDDVLGLADRAGGAGHRLFHGMHRAIAELSRASCNVVADHVLVEKAWVKECACLFAGLPAYLVGLHCPLEVLEQRERDRKDRTLGQARVQFHVIHRYTSYDLELDTTILSPQECAVRICERIEAGPPRAFQELSGII